MEPSTSRESDGFLGEPVLFHPFHGENIELLEHRRRALRRVSFEKGIVFSERALLEGECFFISIEGVEGGWSGHLRIGLTTVDPETRPSIRYYFGVSSVNFFCYPSFVQQNIDARYNDNAKKLARPL
ncbi:hypothetical protein Y032_0085g1815 [Ancylostoma ceylanicum]|uniref:NHR domain-containing protein n=1 Tax=Ancylostoma ceylanicum TaxID=53326 RepID=A0A016TQV4_9BILA|nr:hypothetical protein Y032_0085g1815 [Ancylostoma ceylanicum]